MAKNEETTGSTDEQGYGGTCGPHLDEIGPDAQGFTGESRKGVLQSFHEKNLADADQWRSVQSRMGSIFNNRTKDQRRGTQAEPGLTSL